MFFISTNGMTVFRQSLDVAPGHNSIFSYGIGSIHREQHTKYEKGGEIKSTWNNVCTFISMSLNVLLPSN